MKQDKLPITVAIPVYNGERFLAKAIQSVLNQDTLPRELLIVENNSEDESLKVAEKFINKIVHINYRIIINSTTIPYANNWNRCIKEAHEDYVLILHADDELKTNALKDLYKAITENSNVAIAGASGEVFINAEGNIIKDTAKNYSLFFQSGDLLNFYEKHGLYIPCSSVLMNKKLLAKKELFFPVDKAAADELLWFKIVAQYSVKILGTSLTLRRMHDQNTEYLDMVNKKEWIAEAYYNFKELSYYIKSDNQKQLFLKMLKKRTALSMIGIASAVSRKFGKQKVALWYFHNGLKINPNMIINYKTWKVILIITLKTLGLYNSIYKIYKSKKLNSIPF